MRLVEKLSYSVVWALSQGIGISREMLKVVAKLLEVSFKKKERPLIEERFPIYCSINGSISSQVPTTHISVSMGSQLANSTVACLTVIYLSLSLATFFGRHRLSLLLVRIRFIVVASLSLMSIVMCRLVVY